MSIAEAFKRLNVGADSDHDHVYTVSYDYLKAKDFDDTKAFKNCLVALINLDKYHRADELICKVPESSHLELILEISYVYYKLGKAEKFFALYNKHSSSVDGGVARGLKHMAAQTHYKIGQYKQALDLYNELLRNTEFDNRLDLVTNEKAVVSQINFADNTRMHSNYNLEAPSYDLHFNDALVELSNNNLVQCTELLQQARRLCEAQNDMLELLPIVLTQLYVYDLQGRHDEALTTLDVGAFDDSMLALILKTNKHAFAHSKLNNVLERDLDYTQNVHHLRQKLTSSQYQAIMRNSMLLHYVTLTASPKLFKEYSQQFPLDLTPLVYKILLHLGITYTDLVSNPRAASRSVDKHLESVKGRERVAALVLLVYLGEKQANFSQAYFRLNEAYKESLASDEQMVPAVYTLHKMFRPDNRHELVDKLVGIEDVDPRYYQFIKHVGFDELKSGNTESANKVFAHLQKVGSDSDLLIECILNNTQENLMSIERLALATPVEELLSTDIEALETQLRPVARPTPIPLPKKRTFRVSKKHTPKFGPNKVLKPEGEFEVDEERWLPMRLRLYYRPTKKDKRRGHQGAIEEKKVEEEPEKKPANLKKGKKKKGRK